MKFETRTLILISVAVVINIVGGETVHLLKLPVYLDSIGTILVGVLAGPLPGGIAGVLTNIIWALIIDPVAAPFVSGLLGRAGWFTTWWRAAIAGAIVAIPSTIVGVPIIVFLFGGVTGGGPDFASAYMLAVGSSLLKSVGFTTLGINTIDKVLTALVVWNITRRLPLRLTTKFGFFVHAKA